MPLDYCSFKITLEIKTWQTEVKGQTEENKKHADKQHPQIVKAAPQENRVLIHKFENIYD